MSKERSQALLREGALKTICASEKPLTIENLAAFTRGGTGRDPPSASPTSTPLNGLLGDTVGIKSLSNYNQKALAKIRSSLRPYATIYSSSAASTVSNYTTTSGVNSGSGYSSCGESREDGSCGIRVSYNEDESQPHWDCGGACGRPYYLDRPESPRSPPPPLPPPRMNGHGPPTPPGRPHGLCAPGRESPPVPPPRNHVNGNTPTPPAPPPSLQLLKRMSPVHKLSDHRSTNSSPRGTSPIIQNGRTSGCSVVNGRPSPMVVQNSMLAQQQLNQQLQALSICAAQQRGHSPTASLHSHSHQSWSAHSSPRTQPSPPPLPPSPGVAIGARAAKATAPVIMQSVKSTQVQKPVLQTAVAVQPLHTQPGVALGVPHPPQPPPPSYHPHPHAGSVSVVVSQSSPVVPPPPSYPHSQSGPVLPPKGIQPPSAVPPPPLPPHNHPLPPPPPYSSSTASSSTVSASTSTTTPVINTISSVLEKDSLPPGPSSPRCLSPAPSSSSGAPSDQGGPTVSNTPERGGEGNEGKTSHQSPIPQRKQLSREIEEERRESRIRNFSPQAFKFFMEQHVENVLKQTQERQYRREQLEQEMSVVGISDEAKEQMRKMLSQKETNYIRLKRSRMDKSFFTKIKTIGVGAFGEVALVKNDMNQLYAMKTLRKTDVLKRNQVAHVKAERDILSEADNEWVVKLYYSFQDKESLYFVMAYIPGGDLMSLLIRMGIFSEPLARFYMAELVMAIESVHKMGFIHRDIKPDNILIDRDGHIKLTDFGLCTGFRWTHNSKYYQRNGHVRQDSMDPDEDWEGACHCKKPLERRRRRQLHQRCQAHSLVGTPNYISPEVLMRVGYTQLCDWWSAGVILFEMLIGHPPFLADSPAETQMKIIHFRETMRIPPTPEVTPEAEDIMRRLLTGAESRLGKDGAQEIKEHPFFHPLGDVNAIRKTEAPYIPKIKYPTDTSNFDPVDETKVRDDDAHPLPDADNHAFFEFTFRRFFEEGGGVPLRPPSTSNSSSRSGSRAEDKAAPVYV
ncbi:unnamed protein product [Cyprideis torosa]|uniref:non-specific serine/threonine protein kinase n=1 Tax=Cyprideis torosa TaxID=163714 RepID=A0A7R8ZPT6_9CRUS|nr:unnamed protein product [Cyprideis torosa]CAG0889036.1 unnamed protein product [Cyprideis torosa]